MNDRIRSLRESDATLGIVMFIIGGVLIAGVLTGAISRILNGGPSRTITAVFADTRQLADGDPVRIDGVDVGTVQSLRLDADHRSATVTLGLDGSAGPLHRDASAQIRFRTLLGGTFYVDLDRGTPGDGTLGSGQIPELRTGSQVELDDITSIVRHGARTGLETVPGQLAQAFSDVAEPAGVLSELARQSPSLAGGLSALRGEQPSSDVQTLITQAGRTVAALDAPDEALRTLVAGTAAFVQVTAARRADLIAALNEAPGVMTRTDTTLSDLDHTVAVANPLLRSLNGAAPRLAPAVRSLRGTVIPASTLLHRAVPLLDHLKPAVTRLAAASGQALPLLNALAPSLNVLDHAILPFTGTKDPQTGLTPAEMVGPGLGSGLGAVGAYEDNIGGFVRFPVTSGSTFLYLPCQTYFGNPDQNNQLLGCEDIKTAIGAYLNFLGSAGATGASR
jgi:virulence factor Mce-like protein